MDLPKFNETFNPILYILKNGEVIHHRELLNSVVDKYYSHLPKELLEIKTKSGDVLIRNRIAWGKSYLKKGGFVEYPKRGLVKITKNGIEAANKKLELKDVELDFMNFYTEESAKHVDNNVIESSSPQDLIDSGFNAIESQTKSELSE